MYSRSKENIMKIQKTINCGPIQVVAILAAFAFTQSAQAECINTVEPPADLLFNIDANNGCDDIQGQEGCYIKGGVGECTYIDPSIPSKGGFKVTSWVVSDPLDGQIGSLAWQISAVQDMNGNDLPLLYADTIIYGGGSGGKNNCGMGYKSDVGSGYGGDCKNALDGDGVCTTAVFQNFTGLSVCSDLETDEAPPEVPVAIDLPTCGIPTAMLGELGDDLDNTGIICPGNGQETVVCNFEKGEYAWGTVGANELGQQEEVCCRCNPGTTPVKSCFVADNADDNSTEDNDCAKTLTSDPTQEVIITLERNDNDPCTKIVSGGKVYKTCW